MTLFTSNFKDKKKTKKLLQIKGIMTIFLCFLLSDDVVCDCGTLREVISCTQHLSL